jgi:tetratricopeptide (TPR) repeat protein
MIRRAFIVTLCLLFAGGLFAVGTTSSSGSSGGSNVASNKSPTAQDWYTSGYNASQAKKYDEAVADFQKAIALKSDYADAYNMLGFCTRKLGDVSKAFNYYETALKLKPNFPEAREYYGEAYLQEGNLTKAVQQYIILQKSDTKIAAELLEQIDLYVNPKS